MIPRPDSLRWADWNAGHLNAALRWLQTRLDGLALLGLDAPPGALAELPEVREAARALDEYTAASEAPPALDFVSSAFGLGSFERDVLLLTAAAELDPDLGFRCGRALGTDRAHPPTFALALALFDAPAWEALAPTRPLRYWHLVHVTQAAEQPLIHAALRADERLVHYLKGLDDLDTALLPLVHPLGIVAEEVPADDRIDQAVRALQGNPGRPPILVCLGANAASKRLLAAGVAARLGVRLYVLDVRDRPASAEEQDTFVRRWNREAALLRVGLFVDASEGEPDPAEGGAHRFGRFLDGLHGLVVLATPDVRTSTTRPLLRLDVGAPTVAERAAAWARALGPDAGSTPDRLAVQFELDLPAIAALAATTLAATTLAGRPSGKGDAGQGCHPAHEALWDACRLATRPRLDTLARRIEPRASWSDLVLPEAQTALLRRIVDAVEQRGRVLGDWGFEARHSRGLGLSVLFAGESGTGKTMAAEVLADTLRLDLYRIDLSTVVSKYIGETEKNLRRLFDAAEGGGTLLFFDEADALFGKRSEVKDSHDRYANIEVNYLLQRIETFRGLAVLATNRRNALDDAFLRRLRYVVTFPFPGRDERRLLWARAFPPGTPTLGLDVDWLARFTLSGGVIHTIALNAAFAAAAAGQPVTMPVVLEAVRIELDKREQPVSESLLRGPATNGHAPALSVSP